MAQKKIMIVDDDLDILELVGKHLSNSGFIVLKVSKGSQALAKAKEFLPDVILMDIMMEDMDGAEVVRQLQSDKQANTIPVIFLSGIVVTDDRSTPPFVKVGERKYPAIAKPFSGEKLVLEIKRNL